MLIICPIWASNDYLARLSFLLWSIGVSKQTSNAAVYGDCGRKPTIIQITKRFVDFFKSSDAA